MGGFWRAGHILLIIVKPLVGNTQEFTLVKLKLKRSCQSVDHLMSLLMLFRIRVQSALEFIVQYNKISVYSLIF